MSGASKEQIRGSLPPWLWIWLVAYAFSLPGVLWIARFQLSELLGVVDDFGGHGVFFARLYYLPSFLIGGAILAGTLTIFLPWIRAAYLERRFRLAASYSVAPSLVEISDFVHLHAPGIEVRNNLLRTDQLAFVYPLGYRRAAIALFGGLVKLWRSNRKAAEAVILHEIAHYRNGDTLLVGAGSLFTTLVRYIPLVSLVSLLIAVPARFASFMTAHDPGSDANLVNWGVLLQIAALWVYVMFYVMVTLVGLVIGIWCAEFNADRFAMGAQGSSSPLMGILQNPSHRTSRWRWLIFRFTHPPDRLRIWMAGESAGIVRTMLLLLLFPIAAVMQTILEELYYIAGLGFDAVYSKWELLDRTMITAWLVTQLKAGAWYWLAMAALIALWPIVARYWEQLFCGQLRKGRAFRSTAYNEYTLAAVVLAAVAGLYLSAVLFYRPVAKYDIPESRWVPAEEYSLDLFQPSWSFSVGQGWWALPADEVYDVFTLGRADPRTRHIDKMIRFQNVHVVFRPALIGEDPFKRINLLPAPDDMVKWFQDHPYLDTTHASPIIVGGASGVQFGASISSFYTPKIRTGYCSATKCLPLFFHSEGHPGSWFGFVGKERTTYRVIVLDVKGETIVIIVSAPVGGLSDFLPEVEQVLSNVKWETFAPSEDIRPHTPNLVDLEVTKLLEIPTQGPLSPGEYLTAEFEPQLSFKVDDGWSVPLPEKDQYLYLLNKDRGLAFANVQTVYDPKSPELENSLPAPEDMVSWLQRHPYLETEKPMSVTVGGVTGKMIDTLVSSMPQDYPSACPGPCVPLFQLEGNTFFLLQGYHNRIIVLEVKGKTVIIVVESPTDDFDEFLWKTEALLTTVKWRA